MLWGSVYDFSPFLERHPGGARAILRLSGRDSTGVFEECHTPEIQRLSLPAYRLGALKDPGSVDSPPAQHDSAALPDSRNGTLDPLGAVYSPFPAERFDGTGLEAFRFQWAASDWLLRRDAATGEQRRPTEEELRHVHRAKSHVAPLNYNRDWLHVSQAAPYAADMVLKEKLLSDPASVPLCYVTSPESREAEEEVLHAVIDWCCARHPERFSTANGTVSTYTVGYERTFQLADYAEQPLRLAGMLVQEDFYLLVEDDVSAGVTPSGMEYHLPTIPDYDQSMHQEDHPSGKHHIFTASASCFSIDAVDIHMRPMSSIHKPYVP